MSARGMRLAVYTDYSYGRSGDAVFAERAFVLFLGKLAHSVDRMVLVGRLNPDLGESHYRVADEIEFVPLPHYHSLIRSSEAIAAMARSLGRFWRVLGGVDAVWLMGPHPLSLAFAALAAIRRKRIMLGVRQNTPHYARVRHPDRRLFHVVADVLDGAYRALARVSGAVVVGPQLAHRYRSAKRLLQISVSLVSDRDLADPREAGARAWDGNLQVLSVGRLETEKNPLLLADILAGLGDTGRSWRLVVCGEGPLEDALRERLASLGVADRALLRGYMPIDGGLMDLYRESNAFLHVSWTEGVPQVLLESFAAGTPVVATAVGGVPGAVGDDALLVPPGDAGAAVKALERLATDAELRRSLTARGLERVRRQTLEVEAGRVAEFLRDHA